MGSGEVAVSGLTPSDTAGFQLLDYRYEYRNQLVGFTKERGDGGTGDMAVVVKQLQPQTSLVGLLNADTDLRHELGVASGSRGLSEVAGNGGSGSQHLPTQNLNLISSLRKCAVEAYDGRSIPLGPLTQVDPTRPLGSGLRLVATCRPHPRV